MGVGGGVGGGWGGVGFFFFFFFKQKTAYEIVSRDWSSDVCSSDLLLLCMRWVLQRGGAPKQRPAFAADCRQPINVLNISPQSLIDDIL